ncbi:hypothetical protein IFM89_021661 [Coptis chinensis]|uniref:Uncharacterized protein n=1 Tax=Coptis chinensis TaxID=261450 RepID=A0A835IBQ9_9MAGN|nr:hypothetical protein IFM89_021661 [Coptis chinensis]
MRMKPIAPLAIPHKTANDTTLMGTKVARGMNLGKLQIAFALANLVNAFKWSCVDEGKLPDMSEQLFAVTLMKTPLEGRISTRKV